MDTLLTESMAWFLFFRSFYREATSEFSSSGSVSDLRGFPPKRYAAGAHRISRLDGGSEQLVMWNSSARLSGKELGPLAYSDKIAASNRAERFEDLGGVRQQIVQSA
jgi:hypothetical protein